MVANYGDGHEKFTSGGGAGPRYGRVSLERRDEDSRRRYFTACDTNVVIRPLIVEVFKSLQIPNIAKPLQYKPHQES
jgi:hypothetical protein